MLTEQCEQLTATHGQLQGQINKVARVFTGLWPAVEAHYTRMPANVPETDILERALHFRIVFTDLHKENVELQAALVAWPVLPDPEVVYIAQIIEKQGQATQMQETLNSAVCDAYDLLKGLQECSTALTVKT